MPKYRRKSYVYLLGILVTSVLLSVLVDFPHDSEHWTHDLVTSVFSISRKSQHDSIVLVYVSDETLAGPPYVPYVSPVDRELLAKLVSAIDQAEAGVIGLDIILDRHTELNKDEMLRRAFRHTRAKMVLGAIDEPKTGSPVQSGFFFATVDGKDPDIGYLYFDEHHSSLVISDHVIRVAGDTRRVCTRQHPGAMGPNFEPQYS